VRRVGNSARPRILGDDYQACFFWLQACRLFFPHSHVVRVSCEAGAPQGFDDVVAFYDPPLVDPDTFNPVYADYHQIKFHTDYSGAVSWQLLMDPAFINAKSRSFLQRLRDAHRRLCRNGRSVRFHLVTNWAVHPDDDLATLISGTTGAVYLNKLFGESGKRTGMRAIRDAWRNHLGVCDEELGAILRTLRLKVGSPGLQDGRNRLNDQLLLAGLRPVDFSAAVNPYDELVRKLVVAGKREFDREALRKVCEREGLWVGKTVNRAATVDIGIRSFLRWAEHLEDETEHLLCLLKYFDKRHIRNSADWQGRVLPEVQSFLSEHIVPGRSYNLHLDTHCSIAFAAGYCLGPKAGVDVAPVQRTRGRCPWRPEVGRTAADLPKWVWSETEPTTGGSDVALALSVSQWVMDDVKTYIESSCVPVGRIVHGHVEPGPGPTAIRDATHAWLLAQEVVLRLKKRTAIERTSSLHLFMAVPNGLAFFLGQLAHGFGRCYLYEYDFESNAPGVYQRSFVLP